jgi:XTP/dITP diphosphohydrolase
MKAIRYATQNSAKVKSLIRNLSMYDIKVIHAVIDLTLSEPRINNVRVIAREKAKVAFETVREPLVALDAGCFIHSLNGFPGAFVNHTLKTIGLEGILKLLEGKTRQCEFRECLAFYDGKQSVLFESSVFGTISEEPKGKVNQYSWSILSRVFSPLGEQKTLAEMTESEYLTWSSGRHQNSYATKFAEWFVSQEA